MLILFLLVAVYKNLVGQSKMIEWYNKQQLPIIGGCCLFHFFEYIALTN